MFPPRLFAAPSTARCRPWDSIVELAGLEAPGHLEGRSLLPLLRNPGRAWEHVAITTYGYRNHAVRSDRHRYIRYSDGSEELYDHDSDPKEWHNLASDPRFAEIRRRLAESLPVTDAPDAFFQEPGAVN